MLVLVRAAELRFKGVPTLCHGLDHNAGGGVLSGSGVWISPFAASGPLGSKTAQVIHRIDPGGKLLVCDGWGRFILFRYAKGEVEQDDPTIEDVGRFALAYAHYTANTKNKEFGVKWAGDVLRHLGLTAMLNQLPS